MLLVGIAFAINESLASLFLDTSTKAYTLTVEGFYLFALGFLFSGVNIFASGLFTAYSNGKVSAFISFLRTFFFITVSILVLPHYMGLTGVWLAVPIAECVAFFLSVYYFMRYKERYMYEHTARLPQKRHYVA